MTCSDLCGFALQAAFVILLLWNSMKNCKGYSVGYMFRKVIVSAKHIIAYISMQTIVFELFLKTM